LEAELSLTDLLVLDSRHKSKGCGVFQLETTLEEIMFKALPVALFVLCIGFCIEINAQDASQKTQDLVAALDKTKYKKKEKRGLKIEFYVGVKNEAVVKKDPAEYSGLYESSESDYGLEIRIGHDGTATGGGYDSIMAGNDTQKSNFTLRDARVDGALLTATKVYDNGLSERFEAVFTNRTVSSGTNPSNIETTGSSYGIGFIQTQEKWTNRVFLEFRR